jgi:HlyD family secretion protein
MDWSTSSQDLLNSLPKGWTRSLLHLLVVFTVVALPWAMLTKVDETGQARGVLQPKGAVYRMDAPVAGTVIAVNVKKGQVVQAGQVLLELGSETLHANLQQTRAELNSQLDRLTQLESTKNQLLIATSTQRQQNQAQQSEKFSQIEQIRQNLRYNRTAVDLATNRLKKDQREVDRYRDLQEEGVVPAVKVTEVERVADESLRMQQQTKADRQQAEVKLQELQSSHESLVHSGELAVLKIQEQLDNLTGQITSLQADIIKSRSQIQSLGAQIEQRKIRAPRSGILFELAVEKEAAVVQPGQLVAQIAPQNTTLILKAQMPSQESGFLAVDLPVRLKFDAYPFQDYGVTPGRISWVSPTSRVIDTPQGQTEVFDVEVSLDRTQIASIETIVTLNAGQSATAEVIVRQRRLIDFVLDPFRQLQQGGLKL